MEQIDLKELVGGALQEQFGISFEKVIANLQNPNTSYRTARQITIKLKFNQNEARDDVKCSISVDEKLAPQSALETSFTVGTDIRTGEMYVQEYGKHTRGQVTIDEVFEQDKETPHSVENNVLDLRRATN